MEREQLIARIAEVEAQINTCKAKSDSLKVLNNGTYGKTGSPYSILYAPDLMLAVTLTGQLSLLMLIEALELVGISVISANTDGIVTLCPRNAEWLMDSVCSWWMKETNLELEHADYASLHSRDVNSYIALKADGSAKLKGAFAPPKIIGPSWPNPTGEVCTNAVVAYLRDGTPIETTICACTDIRLFVYTRKVAGGGEWIRRVGPPVVAGIRAKRLALSEAGWVPSNKVDKKEFFTNAATGEILELTQAYKTLIVETHCEFLGKTARWYYCKHDGGDTLIRGVATHNLVATSEGSRPLMELPDTVPLDLDYERYIEIAKSLLVDVGII